MKRFPLAEERLSAAQTDLHPALISSAGGQCDVTSTDIPPEAEVAFLGRLLDLCTGTIFDEAPGEFEGWVARIIDAGKQNNPRVDYSFFAETLILIAWRPYADNSADFVHPLIAAARKMRLRFGWSRDPVVGVHARLMAIAQASNSPQGGLLFRAFLREVSFTDQLGMLGLRL